MNFFKTISTAIVLSTMAFGAQAGEAAKIAHKLVTVAATNDEWTPTTVKVEKGDILIIQENGSKIKIGAWLGEVSADGTQTGEGALLIKIGVGAGQRIGSHGYTIAEQAGPVKLKIQDSNYTDNSGTFSAHVLHIPASIIPQGQPVEAQ